MNHQSSIINRQSSVGGSCNHLSLMIDDRRLMIDDYFAFFRAVDIEAFTIRLNSLISSMRGRHCASFNNFERIKILIQIFVSFSSFKTIFSLCAKSARLSAPLASPKFGAGAVPDRSNCLPICELPTALGKLSDNFIIRAARSIKRFSIDSAHSCFSLLLFIGKRMDEQMFTYVNIPLTDN